MKKPMKKQKVQRSWCGGVATRSGTGEPIIRLPRAAERAIRQGGQVEERKVSEKEGVEVGRWRAHCMAVIIR